MAAPRGMAGRPGGAKSVSEKLVLLGESAVGKSSLVLRFVKNQFDEYRESTIGAAFLTQTLPIKELNTSVKFEIWDTAGQERYKSLAPMYYRNAAAAIVVYDITQAASLDKAKMWVKELQKQHQATDGRQIKIALVGNKLDLVEDAEGAGGDPSKRAVELKEAEEFAASTPFEPKPICFEASAKTGKGVQEIFKEIGTRLANEPKPDTRAATSNRMGGVNLRPEATDTQQNQGCQC